MPRLATHTCTISKVLNNKKLHDLDKLSLIMDIWKVFDLGVTILTGLQADYRSRNYIDPIIYHDYAFLVCV